MLRMLRILRILRMLRMRKGEGFVGKMLRTMFWMICRSAGNDKREKTTNIFSCSTTLIQLIPFHTTNSSLSLSKKTKKKNNSLCLFLSLSLSLCLSSLSPLSLSLSSACMDAREYLYSATQFPARSAAPAASAGEQWDIGNVLNTTCHESRSPHWEGVGLAALEVLLCY